MKIIDLYNKIANGEELPEYIQWRNLKFKKCDIGEEYYNINCDMWLFKELDSSVLNEEIEILEEEKKIPEKLDIRQEKNIKNNWKWKVYGKEHSYNISTPQKIIADKVNEICDYLKSKGE